MRLPQDREGPHLTPGGGHRQAGVSPGVSCRPPPPPIICRLHRQLEGRLCLAAPRPHPPVKAHRVCRSTAWTAQGGTAVGLVPESAGLDIAAHLFANQERKRGEHPSTQGQGAQSSKP